MLSNIFGTKKKKKLEVSEDFTIPLVIRVHSILSKYPNISNLKETGVGLTFDLETDSPMIVNFVFKEDYLYNFEIHHMGREHSTRNYPLERTKDAVTVTLGGMLFVRDYIKGFPYGDKTGLYLTEELFNDLKEIKK